MKCNHPAVCLVLAFLATLVLAGPTDAGEQVPFKGRLEGVVTVTPLTPPFIAENRGPKPTYNLDTPTPCFPRKAPARCR
jgi:hypothetical protein